MEQKHFDPNGADDLDPELDIAVILKKTKPQKKYQIVDLGITIHLFFEGSLIFGRYAICEVIGRNIYMVTFPCEMTKIPRDKVTNPCDVVKIPIIHNSHLYLKWLLKRKLSTIKDLPVKMLPLHVLNDCKMLKVI